MNYRRKRIIALLGTMILSAAAVSGCSGNAQNDNSSSEKTNASSREDSTSSKEDNTADGSSASDSPKDNATADSTTADYARLDTADLFTARDKEIGYDENDCVTIRLADGSSASSSDSVAIDGDTITITEEGTYLLSGSLSDGQIQVNADDTAKVQLVLDQAKISCSDNAAIYAVQADKVFITMADGSDNTLATTGNFQSDGDTNVDGAVFCKCDLTLNGNGQLDIQCPNGHGIVSKDDLAITTGTYNITAGRHALSGKDSVRIADGSFTVSSGKDAIHSENTDDTTKGFVYVAGGTFRFTAAGDGIDSSSIAQIDGGTFTISSSGAKGVKADKTVVIDGGSIDIQNSEEGMQGQTIAVNDGTIQVVSKDDGFNAADSSDSNNSGRNDAFASDSSCGIQISGGTIHIHADGDGLDSNGALTINGGETYISGPSNDGNGSLDCGTEATITGGTVVAAGSSGMAENFGSASTQCAMMVTLSSMENAGKITLKDSDGNELISYDAEKSYNCVIISTPDIRQGETYTVTCGSTDTTVEMTNMIYGESRGMGGMHGGGRDHGRDGAPGGRDHGTDGGMGGGSDAAPGGMPNGSSDDGTGSAPDGEVL